MIKAVLAMAPKRRTRALARALFARRGDSPAKGHFRADLQGLRAVAVLLVALNHVGLDSLSGGYVGVDVFFVLSGFLITGLLLHEARANGRISIPQFYVRRARRILPAAALTLVVTDIAAYHLLNLVRAREVLWDSIAAAFFGANIRFASQGADYFASSQPPSPIQHYWSLAVEEQFYLVWPALLALVLFTPSVVRVLSGRPGWKPGRVGRRQLRRLLVVIVLAAVASLAWSVLQTGTHPALAYFSTFTRAWELGLGAALAIATRWLGRVPQALRAVCGWLGLAAIGFAAATFTSTTAFPGFVALIPTVGAALVIAAGIGSADARWAAARVLAVRPMRYIGDRSYAFYLWHWPVLIIAAEYAGHALSLAIRSLLLAAAFAISVVSYRFVENPIRRSDWSPGSTAFLWPASVGAVVLVAAMALHSIDAKAIRLDDAAAAAVLAAPASPAASASPRGTTGSAAATPSRVYVVPTLPAVVAAVAAARRSAPLPSILTPSPAQLLDDHYGYPDGCGANDGQTTSSICRLGNAAASKTVVVFGDSHVEMWLPPLLARAQVGHFAIVPLIKQGCTPPRWVAAWGKAECASWYRWALGKLRQLKPTVTVVGGALDAGQGRPYADMLTALRRTATTARRYSKVVVMDDPPSLSSQPVDCILGRGANMNRCSSTPNDEQLSVREGASAVVSGAGGTFLDTTGWFCYQNLCPMVIGNRIAYVDSGHITQTYATALAPQLGATLKRIGGVG